MNITSNTLIHQRTSCPAGQQVRLAEGDKWQDVEYLNHTSLKTYMPYMMGGGYVLSADLAHVILGINQQVACATQTLFVNSLPSSPYSAALKPDGERHDVDEQDETPSKVLSSSFRLGFRPS